MSHAAFSGGSAMRLGAYLPALAIFLGAAPSSCSSCFEGKQVKPRAEFAWDFTDFDVLDAAFEGHVALELNLLERIADPDDAKKLHDFGRDEGSSLAQTRELLDNAIGEAEAGLQKKWSRRELVLRMVSASLAAPFYEPDEGRRADDTDDDSRYDRASIAESVEQLRQSYPDRADTLPDLEKLQADAKKAEEKGESGSTGMEVVCHFRMAYTDRRPEGDFKTKKDLELALLRVEPMKASVRLVYEIVTPGGVSEKANSDPVLALEVITLKFECDGEKWKAVSEAEADDDMGEE